MPKLLKYVILNLAVMLLIGFFLKGCFIHEQFNSEKWKNWKETESEMSLRWDMINSLKTNYQLKGMSKDEIIELLGEPDSESQNEFGYYLGYSSHGINTGHLSIIFDKNENVAEYSVWDG